MNGGSAYAYPMVEGLGPQEMALVSEAAHHTLGVERRRVLRTLARGLRDGNARVVRGINEQGVAATTLSLSASYWLLRAALVVSVAVVIHALGRPESLLLLGALTPLGVCCLLVAAWRALRAAQAKRQFVVEQRTMLPAWPAAMSRPTPDLRRCRADGRSPAAEVS